MQDNYQYEQLGLVYESMVSRGMDMGSKFGSSKSLPDFHNDGFTSIKIPIRGIGMRTLKYDRRTLLPFLSKQNDSIKDFLVAIGVPDWEDWTGIGPVEYLDSSQIVYLVRMINKEYGSSLRYNARTKQLADGGDEERSIEDDDSMRIHK
jgi:hypothetical protein